MKIITLKHYVNNQMYYVNPKKITFMEWDSTLKRTTIHMDGSRVVILVRENPEEILGLISRS